MAQPVWERLFKSTDSAEGASPFIDVGARTFHTFVLTPITGGSSLEIQGNMARRTLESALTPDALWHPVRWWEYHLATGEITGPHMGAIAAQLGIRVFYFVDPWRHLRVIRSGGGSITLDYWGQEKGSLELSKLSIQGPVTVQQGDPTLLHTTAHLTYGLEEIGVLHPVPTEEVNPRYDLLEAIVAAIEALELTTTVLPSAPVMLEGPSVQSDPDRLQVSAHLKVGLEDVGDLNGLPVNVREMPDVGIAGDVTVKPKIWVSQKVVIPFGATSGALDANDALGNKFSFDRSVDGEPLPVKGRILTIRRYDPDDDVLADTIHIFDSDFTAAASDAAFTISAADSLKHITSQIFPAGTDLGSAKVAELTDVNVDYYCPGGVLVCQESTTGTPTIASASVMPLVQICVLPLV